MDLDILEDMIKKKNRNLKVMENIIQKHGQIEKHHVFERQ